MRFNFNKLAYGLFIALVMFGGYITFLMTVEVNDIYKHRQSSSLSYKNFPDKGKTIVDNLYTRIISTAGFDTLRTTSNGSEHNNTRAEIDGNASMSKISNSIHDKISIGNKEKGSRMNGVKTTSVVASITKKHFDKNATKKDTN